jgi:N-acetylmuramoyl-L-alanine amidase
MTPHFARRLTALITAGFLCALPLLSPAQGLTIDLVFPRGNGSGVVRAPNNHDQMRFNGTTDPEATLTLNGEGVQIWSTGAFAGLLDDLRVGENGFVFEARLAGQRVRREITVIRESPQQPLPAYPARIVELSIQPADRIVAIPGDEVTVSFMGSPGGVASATLGRWTRLRLTEVPNRSGQYRGTHRVVGDEGWDGDEITIRLSVTEEEGSHVEVTRPLMLSLLDTENPRILEVESPDRRHCPLYTDPGESQRLMDLPEGTRLVAWGRRQEHWRVRLAPDVMGWIPVNDGETFTRLLPRGTRAPRGTLRSQEEIGASPTEAIVLGLRDRHPVVIAEDEEAGGLRVDVYGLTETPPAESGRWERIAEEHHRLSVPLSHPLWGWDSAWEDHALRISLLSQPSVAPSDDAPLRGLRIAIDAGHGGRDEGATGSTRTEEKEINLAMALQLRDLLEARGASTIMIREDDQGVSLNQRVRSTDDARADLFVSLHCNSISPWSDPLEVQGVSVYHSHPLSRGLAQAIHDAVAELDGAVEHGIRRSNFRVTRPSQRPSVLVETLYLSHPGDEAMLLDESRRGQLVMAIAEGIETCLAHWGDTP